MTVRIFTDGACVGNPGPGGWSAILRYGEHERVLSGGEPQTTNNRMELLAVIFALEALTRPCEVILTTDSRYVSDSISLGRVYSWQKRSWLKKGGVVPNADLWQRLLPLLEKHEVTFEWVKGHNGHPENERCDAIATFESVRRTSERREGGWLN